MIQSIIKKYKLKDNKDRVRLLDLFRDNNENLVSVGLRYLKTRILSDDYNSDLHHDAGTTIVATGVNAHAEYAKFYLKIIGLPDQIQRTTEQIKPLTGELEEIVE